MSDNSRNTSYEGRSSLVTAYIVKGPIVDGGKGVRFGTMGACMNRTFAANADTSCAHSLGRIPNGYKMIRSSSGGVLYDPSTGTTKWSGQNIDLRATLAGTYSFELI